MSKKQQNNNNFNNNNNGNNNGNGNNFFNNNPLLIFVIFSIVTIFAFKAIFPENQMGGDATNSNIQAFGQTSNKTVPYSELKGFFDSLQALEDISKQAQVIPKNTNSDLIAQLATNHYWYANKLLNETLPELLHKINNLKNNLEEYYPQI